MNNGAPVASATFISDGKVQVSPYLMMELAQLMGAPLFKTNGRAQSSPYPVSPFTVTFGFSITSLFTLLPLIAIPSLKCATHQLLMGVGHCNRVGILTEMYAIHMERYIPENGAPRSNGLNPTDVD